LGRTLVIGKQRRRRQRQRKSILRAKQVIRVSPGVVRGAARRKEDVLDVATANFGSDPFDGFALGDQDGCNALGVVR